MNQPKPPSWAPTVASLDWALAETTAVLAGASGLPAGSRVGDQPESFEDRRRQDNLFGAAPFEIGDNPSGIRWRDYAIRDELLINLFETRSAEPTVLLLAEPTPCLVRHAGLREFAAWWLVALGRWSLAAGAAVHVGDDRPGFACRGPNQGARLAERVGGAFAEPSIDAVDLLPHWGRVFVVASIHGAADVVNVLDRRLMGRSARVYALVAAADLRATSRRTARPAGGVTMLARSAGAMTREAVDAAIYAGQRAGIAVVPVVVADAVSDFHRCLSGLAAGGPP